MDPSVVVALIAAFAAMFGSASTYVQTRGTAAKQRDHESRPADLEHTNELQLKAIDSEQAAELYLRRLRVGLVDTFQQCLAPARRMGASSLALRHAELKDVEAATLHCRKLEQTLAVELAEYGQ